MESVLGTIERAIGTGGATATWAEPVMVEDVALMVAVPTAFAVTNPLAFTLAIPVWDEVQEADAVRSCVEPSEKVPVAVSCSDSPTGNDDGLGATVIEMRDAGFTVTELVPVTP
jgi:hypothetical protein